MDKRQRKTRKGLHIHFFSNICTGALIYRDIKGFGIFFVKIFNFNFWLYSELFSGEDVNVGQNDSIIVHGKGGIDKVFLQILVE